VTAPELARGLFHQQQASAYVAAAMAASSQNKARPGCAKYQRLSQAGTALQPEMQM